MLKSLLSLLVEQKSSESGDDFGEEFVEGVSDVIFVFLGLWKVRDKA